MDGCGGILFDNREMEKFDTPAENIDVILQSIKNKNFDTVDEAATRICPICAAPMVKIGAAQGKVKIDTCYTCGANFLDNNELQLIRNLAEQEGDNHIDLLIQQLYEKDLKLVLGKHYDEDLKTSKLYQFFQRLVDSYMLK